MLVLSRERSEAVLFLFDDGSRGRVEVVRMGHGEVRLGFDFPKNVRIVREELEHIDPQPKPSLAAILKTRRD